MIDLRVLVPDRILVETQARKVSVEGMEGAMTLLPRHIDYVTVIVPGLLTYVDDAGQEQFFAVDSGVLVKKGDAVRVSVRNAIRGDNLSNLRETVEQRFVALEEDERKARAVLASLESDLVRRFIDLGQR